MQHCELVTTDARNQVALPNATAETIGHRKQKVIAGVVAQRIVHFLEAIQVKAQDRK